MKYKVGGRTYQEVVDNVDKHKPCEYMVAVFMNTTEGGGYYVIDEPDVKYDVASDETLKTIEVKSYKKGKRPTITRVAYQRTQADYYAFTEVDENSVPTGKIIFVKRREIHELLEEEVNERGWFPLRDKNGEIREIWQIAETALIKKPYAVECNKFTKDTIESLLDRKNPLSLF